jgi:tetratricopeptide (TPR) repeat protein
VVQLHTLQLAAAHEPARKRDLLLAVAAECAAQSPPRMDEAIAALDRLAQELRGDEGQSLAVRALVALDLTGLAVERLERWAAACMSDEAAGDRLLCAAQLADARLDDPGRALQLLRSLLRRTAQVPQALVAAERIASQRGLRDEMLALYDELISGAAGSHGRHALSYRRAAFLEQSGDLERALVEHLSLFERYPRARRVVFGHRAPRFGDGALRPAPARAGGHGPDGAIGGCPGAVSAPRGGRERGARRRRDGARV